MPLDFAPNTVEIAPRVRSRQEVILDNMLAYLNESPRHWTQGRTRYHGAYCLVGLIRKETTFGERRAIYRLIHAALPPRYNAAPYFKACHIAAFNDSEQTDLYRVKGVLRRARYAAAVA